MLEILKTYHTKNPSKNMVRIVRKASMNSKEAIQSKRTPFKYKISKFLQTLEIGGFEKYLPREDLKP